MPFHAILRGMLSKHSSRTFCVSAIIVLLSACGGGGGSSSSDSENSIEPSSDQAVDLPAVSYYSSAKPLLDRYCTSCHSDSGVAADLSPFPLETYSQVYGKRSALIYVTESGTMPPTGYAGLNADEAELLLAWLNDDAPRGDVSQTPVVEVSGKYTYHRDVRQIIEDKCVDCHTPGGIAPFTLDSYDSIRSLAAAAAFSIQNDTMPPWPPTDGYSSYLNRRGLTQQQEYILLDWLSGDMPEGNPADYVASEVIQEIDPPDFNLKLKLPQAYTPTVRPDDHRCFAIEWPLDEFTYVTNVDVIPDQLTEVHHVIVSIAEPQDAETYYAAGGQDGRPGWYCLGAGGVPGAPLPRQIGGWVPGAGREPTPEGTGTGVKPGSVMVVQMHYNTLVAEPTPDQSVIQVATSDNVQRPARSFLVTDPRWLGEGGMPIPAGDPEVQHEILLPGEILARFFGAEAGVTTDDPWVLHQAFVHMHNLGKSGRTTLVRANGTEQVILDVRDWDFNWQGTYNLERELLIEPGDNIKLECVFDNSQENQGFIDGVQQTAQYVEWGDGSGDEMCLMSVLMTQPKAGYDYSYSPTLYLESPTYRQRFSAGDLVPLKLVLNNFELHDPGQHDHDDAQMHADSEHTMDSDDHGQVYTGHYHVYLDTDEDDAEHLTAWDDSYYYQLPDDISPGLHTLRVNLRGSDHHALGVEQTVKIEIKDAAVSAAASLVDVDSWTTRSAQDDSIAAHRPATVNCPANSWYNEDGALEVETGYCNYLSLGQPSQAAINSGDTVHLVLWHGDLAFEEPAVAHVAVTIAGELIWEEEVQIPTAAEIYDLRIPVNFDAPEGSVVEYHLHNHGYNSWTLLELEVER